MISLNPSFLALLGRHRGPFRIRVLISWDGSNPIDETPRCLSLSYTQSIAKFTQDMLPVGSIDECSITFRNHDWRYSPLHEGGDNDVRVWISGPTGIYGKYVQIDYQVNVGTINSPSYLYCRLFTGYTYTITPSDPDQTVTITVRDASQLIIQKKLDSFTQREMTYTEAIKYVYNLSGRGTSWRADSTPMQLSWVYLDNEGSITQCQNIAGAIAGFFYHDAYGVPCFRTIHQQLANRADYYDLPLTFKSLDIGQDTDKLASDIKISYQPRVVGPPDVVYETDTYYTVLPGETKEFDIRLTRPLYYAFPVDGTDYVVDNHSGRDMSSVVDVGVTISGQRAHIILHNNHASLPARLVYLRVRGTSLDPTNPGEVEKVIASTSLPSKERVRTVDDEFYIQSYAVASYVAENIAALFGTVPYNYVLNSFHGLPQLELLDPVTFYDGKLVSTARHGYIVQISANWSMPADLTEESTFNQTLYIADVPSSLYDNQFFIVGHSSLDSDDVTWH